MKNRIVLYLGCAGIAILFLSAGTMLFREPVSVVPDATLVMRQIGHRLLLASGDSSSRILPVMKTEDATYQISFQNHFSFSPDTLVKVVDRSLREANMPLDHRVSVLQCQTPYVIYGYQTSSSPNATVIPCEGRMQPRGCYVVQIVLDKEVHKGYSMAGAGIIFLSGAMMVLAFVSIKFSNKTKPESAAPAATGVPDGLSIGRYSFYPETGILKKGAATTSLSDKENRLLQLLTTHQNEVISRDRLMKDIWEDDGVFVGRSLDVFVSRLRKKLNDDPTIRIVSIHGKGYRLETCVQLG